MIKMLLVMAALLVPGLAFGANPSAAAPAVPAGAQAAGFTTLAANYDFSQPLYAVQSNWLDCPTTAGNRKVWHQGYGLGINPALPCDIRQLVDNTGATVLDFRYQPGYSAYGYKGANNAIGAQTFNMVDDVSTADYPSASYVESTYRQAATYSGGINSDGGPNGAWWWQVARHLGTHAPYENTIECDFTELYAHGNGFGNGECANHANGAVVQWTSYRTNNLPAGWKTTDYHTYGMLYTTDGSTNVYTCMFVDNILQGCATMSPNAAQYTYRAWLIMGVNSSGATPPQDIDVQYKNMHVWSCAAFATDLCYGNTLVNTTMNGRQFTYYHR